MVISFESSKSGPVSDRVKRAAIRYSTTPSGPTISDIVSKSSTESVLKDHKKLENEYLFLKRQLEKVSSQRFTPLHPKETVRDIFLGKEYSLEFYKTYEDKKALLDEALDIGDGNAILAIALFLKKTLKKTKFYELLQTRLVAARHLANYLEIKYELADLITLYNALGLYEEAAIVSYKQAFHSPNLEIKVRKLKAIQQQHFTEHQDDLIETINLYDRISAIYATEGQLPPIVNDPNLDSVLAHQNVLGTTLYCAYHHWGAPENMLHSPDAVRKMHKLTDRQFIWISVIARSKKSAWKDIEPLVLKKGWLGGKKANSAVDFFRLVNVLHHYQAPSDVLSVYLNHVEPLEDRLNLALKCQAQTAVVDCYVTQRDRVALTKYRDSLVSRSREWFYADNALSVSNTRWKN